MDLTPIMNFLADFPTKGEDAIEYEQLEKDFQIALSHDNKTRAEKKERERRFVDLILTLPRNFGRYQEFC